MSEKTLEQQIQECWGTQEEYCLEIEKFIREHEGASYIEHDTKPNCPVCAVYYFVPYVAFLEKQELLKRLKEVEGE